jgi:hypothetical protein
MLLAVRMIAVKGVAFREHVGTLVLPPPWPDGTEATLETPLLQLHTRSHSSAAA